ncbi:MAG: nucleotide-diphospho-sugar transferase [Monoraphidium minutum]|nr:MAG: nucleotide-diphospho-sugar transferase [Monoraphidium minutum]
MYNEEAHCEVVVERACRMEWPRDRVLIQICDDSTRDDIKRRIDAKAAAMAAAGHAVMVVRRPANVGYKAGNMVNGMAAVRALPWEYVAVFDADFEMPPDFLYQTVWHMAEDPKLAFVQTRWTFTNGYDNLLTWTQKVGLGYHFAVEQRARSFMRTFFGFNGTGGVWRRAAMDAAGGWNMDSTVEDMDLSVRTYVHGWKFRYLDWVHCPNELPPTLSAYKTQQFRWNSGPMVVLKKELRTIWATDKVNIADRLSCSYFFFRFLYTAALTIVCLLCPAIVIWLDPWVWAWPNAAFLVSGNASAVVYMWLVGPLFWPYFLVQTGLGYFRVFAMASGIAGSEKSKSWKVTKKFGKGKMGGRVYHKPYTLELLLAVYYLGMTFAACWYRLYLLGSFTWILVFTFTALSFGDYLF